MALAKSKNSFYASVWFKKAIDSCIKPSILWSFLVPFHLHVSFIQEKEFFWYPATVCSIGYKYDLAEPLIKEKQSPTLQSSNVKLQMEDKMVQKKVWSTCLPVKIYSRFSYITALLHVFIFETGKCYFY